MKGGLRIKEVARDRGVTLSSIARKLGIRRSNMSAIASGARGVSVKVLKDIRVILDCSIDELIPTKDHPNLFRDKGVQSSLDAIERYNYDGIDKTWVNKLMLAHKAHYMAARKAVQ